MEQVDQAQDQITDTVTQVTQSSAWPSNTITNDQGDQVLNPEYTRACLAAYYHERLAYDSRDSRRPIGRYDSTGQVVPFLPQVSNA